MCRGLFPKFVFIYFILVGHVNIHLYASDISGSAFTLNWNLTSTQPLSITGYKLSIASEVAPSLLRTKSVSDGSLRSFTFDELQSAATYNSCLHMYTQTNRGKAGYEDCLLVSTSGPGMICFRY